MKDKLKKGLFTKYPKIRPIFDISNVDDERKRYLFNKLKKEAFRIT